MALLHQRLRGHATPTPRTASAPACTVVPRPHRQTAAVQRTLHVASAQNWKVFGPSADHSDGDAEYYALTSRLSQQYDWFAPRTEEDAACSEELEQQQQAAAEKPTWGLTPKQIAALGLTGNTAGLPDPKTLSSKNYLRGEKFSPDQFGYNTVGMAAAGATMAGRSYTAPRAARADHQSYPEGRPIFLPEAERYGHPPDLPSLLLQQRVIYISMPFVPSVTELVVAQCYYLDFDDRNRNKPIYVYLNSTGCINEKGQAVSADSEFYAMWAALGFTRAPLYTGVTWKAQNQAAVLLAAGEKGHRYSFPHAKIQTAPPILNRVFGPAVDAQLQANELDYATKYYAAILARATGKDLATCQKEYLSRKRYFSVRQAYEEGFVDKLVPGYKLNRFRKLLKDEGYTEPLYDDKSKPKFRFTRDNGTA